MPTSLPSGLHRTFAQGWLKAYIVGPRLQLMIAQGMDCISASVCSPSDLVDDVFDAGIVGTPTAQSDCSSACRMGSNSLNRVAISSFTLGSHGLALSCHITSLCTCLAWT